MSRPIIAFRTNGGAGIGLGHLRRCLTLAQELQKQDAIAKFIITQEPRSVSFLRKYGFVAVELGEEDAGDVNKTLDCIARCRAQALIIDTYAIPGHCMAEMRGPVVAVIDDLANRPLPVDLVINGAANARELTYNKLPTTQLLIGPKYSLLREEFQQEPLRSLRENIERVLITVGGMDLFHMTPRLVAWTQKTLDKVHIDVIIGPFFNEESVRRIEQEAKRNSSLSIHRDPANIRDLMLDCDVAIAGGGQTNYELAATGTPTIAIKLADNQSGNLQALSANGNLLWVGDAKDSDLADNVIAALRLLASRAQRRRSMSLAGRRLVDGCGAKRVAHAIVQACSER